MKILWFYFYSFVYVFIEVKYLYGGIMSVGSDQEGSCKKASLG